MRRVLLYMVQPQYETCALGEARTLDSDHPTREVASEGRPRWYVIQCRARQEERALEHLERQGFECYRPLYEGSASGTDAKV